MRLLAILFFIGNQAIKSNSLKTEKHCNNTEVSDLEDPANNFYFWLTLNLDV